MKIFIILGVLFTLTFSSFSYNQTFANVIETHEERYNPLLCPVTALTSTGEMVVDLGSLAASGGRALWNNRDQILFKTTVYSIPIFGTFILSRDVKRETKRLTNHIQDNYKEYQKMLSIAWEAAGESVEGWGRMSLDRKFEWVCDVVIGEFIIPALAGGLIIKGIGTAGKVARVVAVVKIRNYPQIARKHIASLRAIVSSGDVADQALLKSVIKGMGKYFRPIPFKKQKILGFKITDDIKSVDDLPVEIASRLGAVDDVTYDAAWFAKNRGSYISLQTKADGSGDIYVISREALKQYDEVVGTTGALGTELAEQLGIRGQMVGLQKRGTTGMVKASEMGLPIDEAVTIKTPWGTQTKPAGIDAFIVKNGDEIYMVNAEMINGKLMPIGYRFAK